MRRLIDWLIDNYVEIVVVAVIALFAFGGIVSHCNKEDESMTEWRQQMEQKNSEKEEHRSIFFDKYQELLPQFTDVRDFSQWLDYADFKSIILLHSLIESKSREFRGEEGLSDMIDYLDWTEPSIDWEPDYE